MLALFSLGVPLMVVLLVKCRNRCTCISERTWDTVESSMSFLYKGLKDKHKYWEAVNLMRKALQAVSSTALAPFGAEVQLMFMMAIVVGSFALQALAHPYQR